MYTCEHHMHTLKKKTILLSYTFSPSLNVDMLARTTAATLQPRGPKPKVGKSQYVQGGQQWNKTEQTCRTLLLYTATTPVLVPPDYLLCEIDVFKTCLYDL